MHQRARSGSLQNDAHPAGQGCARETCAQMVRPGTQDASCYPAFTRPSQYALRRPSAGGRLAMAIPARDPFIAYLLVHATMLRGHQVAPAAAALLAEHVNALELLADVVRD